MSCSCRRYIFVLPQARSQCSTGSVTPGARHGRGWFLKGPHEIGLDRSPRCSERAAQNKPGKQHDGKCGKRSFRSAGRRVSLASLRSGESQPGIQDVRFAMEFREKPFMGPDLQGKRFSSTPSLPTGPHSMSPGGSSTAPHSGTFQEWTQKQSPGAQLNKR